jgi:hypothetical protein
MHNHVLTPFSRPENLDRLWPMLEEQRARTPEVPLTWHLLGHNEEQMKAVPTLPWIRRWLVVPPACQCPTYWKLNHFFEQHVEPDGRYGIMADDDFYEPGFFEKLNRHAGEIVVCSMRRGDNVVATTGFEHPTSTVIACRENMVINQAGLPQIFLSGNIARLARFEDIPHADGVMLQALAQCLEIDYAPECFVWWNYLQPGRYNRAPTGAVLLGGEAWPVPAAPGPAFQPSA